MPDHVTLEQAGRHEALFLRIERLLRQAEPIAIRRPSAPVPAETRAAAEALLYDTEHLLAPRTRRALPPAAESFAGLATQLGQALARLDAFEAQRTIWNAALNCYVWRTGLDAAAPVRRLRPELTVPAGSEKEDREGEIIRKKIIARFQERYEEGYEKARKDAREGRLLLEVNPYGDTIIEKT